MNAPSNSRYAFAWEAMQKHPFRLAEIPVEHALSLPVPTVRYGGPGYAQFASPCLRKPMQDPVYSAPDRWWVLDATTDSIRIYARVSALPFCDAAFQQRPVSVTGSMADLKLWREALPEAMDAVTEAFFSDGSIAKQPRMRLLDLLRHMISEPLLPLYRGISPEFFNALES